MDYIKVQMVHCLLVTGKKVKQMGLEPIVKEMILIISNKEFGKMASKSNGCSKQNSLKSKKEK